MTADEFTAVCEEFFAKVGEHADAVQVLATFHESGASETGTTFRKRGIGNYWARVGMVREFLIQDSSRTAAVELGEVIHPED